MKVVGLLSFFDEYPAWLAAAVTSCGKLCDHVVACDGAYALLSGGAGSSGSDQHAAIVDAAEAVGVGFTLHVPEEVWWGGEVEKRAFMFDLGRLVARDPEDWFLVVDADEVVTRVPPDVLRRLEAAEEVVAEYGLAARRDEHPDAEELGLWPVGTRDIHPMRGLYRNIPGLTVSGVHYGYRAGGLDLWRAAPALDLRDLVVEHRGYRRDVARRARQEAYYRTRDLAGIEKESAHA